jgi:hypothetical protein
MGPTKEELASLRAKLQRDLFSVLDEGRRRNINARHPDHWRWKERHLDALDRLERFDNQWG